MEKNSSDSEEKKDKDDHHINNLLNSARDRKVNRKSGMNKRGDRSTLTGTARYSMAFTDHT